MATLSDKDPHSVICFLWAELSAKVIHTEIHLVYGDKCFMRPAIHVWCNGGDWRKCWHWHWHSLTC